jgi:hypothetical protein
MARLLSSYVLAVAPLLVKYTTAQDSSPTGPTFPNTAANCVGWHTVVDGDGGCWGVEQKYGISHADFILWNPDVSEDCGTNFWLGNSYCVKVGAVVSSSSSKSSSTSSTRSSITSSITSSKSSSASISSSSTANATYVSTHGGYPISQARKLADKRSLSVCQSSRGI